MASKVEPDIEEGDLRRGLQRQAEVSFQLALAFAHALRNFLNGNRRIDVLLHDMQGALNHGVLCFQLKRDAGLGFFSVLGIINNHDVQAFVRLRAANVLIDKVGGKVRGAYPTGTGEPIPVHHEDLSVTGSSPSNCSLNAAWQNQLTQLR